MQRQIATYFQQKTVDWSYEEMNRTKLHRTSWYAVKNEQKKNTKTKKYPNLFTIIVNTFLQFFLR